MISYFVAVAWKKDGSLGFANAVIARESPVCSSDEFDKFLDEVRNVVRSDLGQSVDLAIMNFKRLEEPE